MFTNEPTPVKIAAANNIVYRIEPLPAKTPALKCEKFITSVHLFLLKIFTKINNSANPNIILCKLLKKYQPAHFKYGSTANTIVKKHI